VSVSFCLEASLQVKERRHSIKDEVSNSTKGFSRFWLKTISANLTFVLSRHDSAIIKRACYYSRCSAISAVSA